MKTLERMRIYTRGGSPEKEPERYEKSVILPAEGEKDPTAHAWADARFATDIMAEHGLFFALLMPEELAKEERKEALHFSRTFAEIHKRLENNVLEKNDVRSVIGNVIDQMKRFIEYKAEQGEAQKSGKLRSLVWPLFFDHTRHEAERWVQRLDGLIGGESAFQRTEVVEFWSNIMDEHARFVAHLLDPDEFELIETAMSTSNIFREFHEKGGLEGAVAASLKEPGTVTGSLSQNPEIDAVLSAAETILDFKTKAARDVEKARIKSIIDPRLADHVRREAVKFVDELERAE